MYKYAAWGLGVSTQKCREGCRARAVTAARSMMKRTAERMTERVIARCGEVVSSWLLESLGVCHPERIRVPLRGTRVSRRIPRVFGSEMQNQGVLTKQHRENSLERHGSSCIVGILRRRAHPAGAGLSLAQNDSSSSGVVISGKLVRSAPQPKPCL